MKICNCPEFRGWLGCRSQTTCTLDILNENIHETCNTEFTPKCHFFSSNRKRTRDTSPQQHHPICFQDSKVSNLVSEISRKPSNVSKLESSVDPRNFQESRIEFRESSFEGLSSYLFMQCKVYSLGGTKLSTPKKPPFAEIYKPAAK